MATRFSSALVQDVMDTLFARRVSGQLFTAADEKALSGAMRRGGSRMASVPVMPVKTQRVPSSVVHAARPVCASLPLPNSSDSSVANNPKPCKGVQENTPLLPLLWADATRAITFLAGVVWGAPVWMAHTALVAFSGTLAALLSGILNRQIAFLAMWQAFIQRFQRWFSAGMRKRTLLAKKTKRQQRRQKIRAAATAVVASIPLSSESPLQRETLPMAASIAAPPESYALMALPTVQQCPDLQVFITEALSASVPTTVAEVEVSAEVFPARPVVTPLVSDAAVRTLMAHHPQPESLAPHSETERLLHHNRFLAHSINNLAERYFNLQHPPQAGL